MPSGTQNTLPGNGRAAGDAAAGLIAHDIYLSPKQVAEMFSVSQATIFRWLREKPEFPRPLKLSPGCTRFRLADLQAFVAILGASNAP